MRLSLVGLLGYLAIQSAAAPGGDRDRCDYYEYNDICPGCPYKPHHIPRELMERGGGRHDKFKVCYKECPKEYKKCRYYGNHKRDEEDIEVREVESGDLESRDLELEARQRRGSTRYSVDTSQSYTCPRNFRFDVRINIVIRDNKQYLDVRHGYQGGGRRGSNIGSTNLGIYRGSRGNRFRPNELNYNRYCSGSSCSVPVSDLPSFPNVCDVDIFIAIGNNGCYDNFGKNENGFREGTKFIKIRINCSRFRRDAQPEALPEPGGSRPYCRDYCCCPRDDNDNDD